MPADTLPSHILSFLLYMLSFPEVRTSLLLPEQWLIQTALLPYSISLWQRKFLPDIGRSHCHPHTERSFPLSLQKLWFSGNPDFSLFVHRWFHRWTAEYFLLLPIQEYCPAFCTNPSFFRLNTSIPYANHTSFLPVSKSSPLPHSNLWFLEK